MSQILTHVHGCDRPGWHKYELFIDNIARGAVVRDHWTGRNGR